MRRGRRWLPVLAACVMMWGCGRQEADTPGEPQEAQKPVFDFRTQTAAPSSAAVEGEALKLAAYYPYDIPEEAELTRVKCYGDTFAAIVTAPDEETYLFTLQGSTGEACYRQIEEAVFAGKSGSIRPDRDGFFFLEGAYEQNEETGMYVLSGCEIVRVDETGQEKSRVELIEGYRQLDLIKESMYQALPAEPVIDPSGCCYLLNAARTMLCRVDAEGHGNIVADYSEGNASMAITTGSAYDGTPLFAYGDDAGNKYTFFCVDEETGKRREFGEIPLVRSGIRSFTLGADGICYYITDKPRQEQICRWNLLKGTQEMVYDFEKNGITNGSWMIPVSAGGQGLHLYMGGGSERALLCLDEKGCEAKVSLTVWSPDSDEYLRAAASSFTRKNPDISVEFLETSSEWSERENEFTRLKNMAVGRDMPDILCVLPSEMNLLWEKGLLADMTNLICEETRADMLPMLWESGSKKDGQAGFCYGYNAETLITSRELWQEGCWGIMDMVELLEENKTPYLMARYGDKGTLDDRLSNMTLLLRDSLEHFVNFEKKEAYFTGEDFKRFLRVMNRYENDYVGLAANTSDSVMESNSLCCVMILNDLAVFSGDMEYIRDRGAAVGFPDGENGNYLVPFRYLCVGAEPEKEEIVREFLEYLLDGKMMRTFGMSFRESVLRENISQGEDGRWMFYEGDKMQLILQEKPDGTNYLEDYLEWMRNAVTPDRHEEICIMAEEEAAGYFAGDRSLDKTCEMLQNRVQLYLNE